MRSIPRSDVSLESASVVLWRRAAGSCTRTKLTSEPNARIGLAPGPYPQWLQSRRGLRLTLGRTASAYGLDGQLCTQSTCA
jgi:hypothetical protein